MLLAVWLLVNAVRTLAAPVQAVAEQGLPMSVVLPVAGVTFTLGVFLLTGFMSRVCGLALACLEGWLVADAAAVVAAVRERDALLGRSVRWAGGRGVGAGVDDSGHLVVETDSGVVQLDAGEVHLQPDL